MVVNDLFQNFFNDSFQILQIDSITIDRMQRTGLYTTLSRPLNYLINYL